MQEAKRKESMRPTSSKMGSRAAAHGETLTHILKGRKKKARRR